VGVGTAAQAQAHSFVVAETASGLAHLPNLSPAAYGSLYLQEHLPLEAPMRCSVFLLTGPSFCFGDFFLTSMRTAILVQVFQFGEKSSILGKVQDPFAKAITVLRAILTDWSAWRSRIDGSLTALSC